ncbi:hypothetical protein BJX99DRAFT_233362 [Aspergillus californicus]
MSDPIPSATTTSTTTEPPSNAEDRKAAAALSSLNTTEIATDSSTSASGNAGKPRSAADQEALGKAMSRLEMAAGHKGSAKKGKNGNGNGGATAGVDGVKNVKKPAVKVSAEDVGLLVNELDLSKVKATELLRAHEGNANKAITAFIRPENGSVPAVGA